MNHAKFILSFGSWEQYLDVGSSILVLGIPGLAHCLSIGSSNSIHTSMPNGLARS
jgi:hypothetical protein